MTETIKFDLDADGIALLTIDVPGQTMNVITGEFTRDLAELIERIATDAAIKGAVITSGKATGFMAGADLKGMGGVIGGGGAPSGQSKMATLFEGVFALNKLFRRLETCGKPVAAAINGLALGGGLEITLACHYRVCADNPKIALGLPEVMVGLLPGAGGTQRLPRLMGVQAALMYLTQGKNMSPQEAQGFGVVHELAPVAEVVERAKAWVKANPTKATQPWDEKGFKFPGGAGAMNPAFATTFVGANAMVQGKTMHNMNAPIAILSAVYEGAQLPMDTAIRVESKYFTKLVADPQAGNMIRTLFVNKQAAERGARRPKDVAGAPTKKLGMLGAGLMGAGVAMVSAQAGIEVVLLDRDLAAAEKGKQYTADRLAKKRMPQDKADAILNRIHPTSDYADLKGCDLIIEAVFETREIKADVTKATEAVVGADTIFGSNTSTLPITGLAEAWSKPENFIGIHFFSPVEKMPLVEIIVGQKTGPQAIAKALDYVAQIKKTPIVVNDSRGFYTSRCFGTYIQEGLTLLGEGVNPALIENVGKMAGMPVGPLAVNDEVGLDLSYKVGQQTKKDLGDKYDAGPGGRVIETMHELGRMGRKNAKGFYVYPEGGKKYLWPELSATVAEPGEHSDPTPEAVRERLLYRQLVECARCFAEGVLETPEDGDLGAIFGWGFAPHTGGPFSMMDTVGLANVVANLDRLAQAHGERFAPPQLLRDMAAKGESFYGNALKRLLDVISALGAPFVLPSGTGFTNRIAKSAMTEGLAGRDGLPNADHVRLYERWARGGCGLLITGNVQVDRQHLERPGNVVVDGPLTADAKAAWARWAAASSLEGTKAWVQISHAGRQTQVTVNKTPKAPSAVRLNLPGGMFGMPEPLTEPEILDLIGRFAQVAAVSREAGFAGAQVHAAHGYLISQFLSPLANRRTDAWGGCLENRARFLIETVKAVRVATGSDFDLGVKLNSADFQKGGFAFEECITVAGWLADLGIDLLEISGGSYEQPAMMDMEGMEPPDAPKQASTAAREAYFVELAKALMAGSTPPLLVTGGFRSRAAMEQAVNAGIAMVGVARPLCGAPEAVGDLLDGKIGSLPRFEANLRVGPGWLGPNSPIKMVRAINGFAAQGWYYTQLRRLAAGQEPKIGINPLAAFLSEQRDAKTRL